MWSLAILVGWLLLSKTHEMMNNSTLDNATAMEQQPDGGMSMGLGARAVWDSLFVAMIVVAIVGNLIVLWIILGKTVTCPFCMY